MENYKGSSNIRNLMYSGKHPLLPPKSPFPSVSSSYADYFPNPSVGSKAVQKSKEGNTHHQRTSSESQILIEEKPSWLDDLLDEPETPVRRGGHRRSSSDSFAFIDTIDVSNVDYVTQNDLKYKNMFSVPSWISQNFDYYKDPRQASFDKEGNLAKQKNRVWESSLTSGTNPSVVPSPRGSIARQSSGSLNIPNELDGVSSTRSEKLDPVETSHHDPRSSESTDGSHAKPSAFDTETKRAKQQFAQRSRVRKLQYIAELERNVQALQMEGSEVSAELEFLNQQNLILSMENNALKQRLENLAQEQLIKYLEQEVLEREIGRLRALYQQQQQHQKEQHQSSSSHRRTNSRDLDTQFANLSLKHKDTNSSRDPVTGSLPHLG